MIIKMMVGGLTLHQSSFASMRTWLPRSCPRLLPHCNQETHQNQISRKKRMKAHVNLCTLVWYLTKSGSESGICKERVWTCPSLPSRLSFPHAGSLGWIRLGAMRSGFREQSRARFISYSLQVWAIIVLFTWDKWERLKLISYFTSL